MRPNCLARAISLLLVVVVPVFSFSADSGAMLFPRGNVSVNGTTQSRSTALFAGDKVVTGGDSGVLLTSRGNSVQLAANTKMTFSGDALDMTDGGATVTTSSGLRAQALNLKVAPAASTGGRYMLVHRGNTVAVAALQGQLRLDDGRQQMLLEPGKAMTFKVDPTGEPQATPGAKTGGSSVGISNAAAVTVASVAALAGVVLAVVSTTLISPGVASPNCPNGNAPSGNPPVCH
jgi:hypothetical protein